MQPTLTQARKTRDRVLKELLSDRRYAEHHEDLEHLATVPSPRGTLADSEVGDIPDGVTLERYLHACEEVADLERQEYVRLTGREPRYPIA